MKIPSKSSLRHISAGGSQTVSDTKPKSYVIFTDLDGTLLDHDTYSYALANNALEKLRETKTPLILASSKTAAEIAPLRSELGFDAFPAIVENGAGLLAPSTQSVSTISDYDKIIKIVQNAPNALRSKYTGFNDWTAEDVCQQTSLSLQAAKLAKQREYSEPGIWSGNQKELAQFKEYLSDNGLRAQQGGRFLTLSFGAGKVDRMNEIKDHLFPDDPNVTCVALGDAPNDIQMLEHADIGFVMKNDSNQHLFTPNKPDHVTYSKDPGPKGWNMCVLSLFV
jgi:mannosyl-3-phosphoglycerate phosphatase